MVTGQITEKRKNQPQRGRITGPNTLIDTYATEQSLKLQSGGHVTELSIII